jgi:hypothetical protein
MGKKRKITEVKDDPRVQELADCVMFAVNAFRNKPIYDNRTKTMTTWHAWFKKSLTDAGYVLYEPEKEKK